MISWSSLNQKVYQPIIIDRALQSGETFEENKYSQAPLMAGYTWFNVSAATASDGNDVEVYNAGNSRIWPPQQVATNEYLQQPAFAVRARTPEEIFSHRALWIAVGSLVVLVAFQIVDWILRIAFKM